MAFTIVDSSVSGNTASSSDASTTLSPAPQAGDLLVAMCHVNADEAITSPSGWTDAVSATISGKTHEYLISYFIATDATASWTWSWTTSTRNTIIVYCFRPTGATPELDAGPSQYHGSGNETTPEANSIVLSADAVAVVFAGADDNDALQYSNPSNSYTGVENSLSGHQMSGACYRIHTAAGASGVVELTSDITNTHFMEHIAFVEGDAGTIIEIPTGPVR